MTSLITRSTHLAGVACLLCRHPIVDVRGAGLMVIAMGSVGLKCIRSYEWFLIIRIRS